MAQQIYFPQEYFPIEYFPKEYWVSIISYVASRKRIFIVPTEMRTSSIDEDNRIFVIPKQRYK